MWRSSIAFALPFVAFGIPADAEPVLLAKLVLPKAPATAAPRTVTPRATPRQTRVRMHVAAVVNSDGGPVVLLRDAAEARVMPIWIGTSEARAIQIALDGDAFPRPLTHDLLRSTIEALNATVVDVEVSALRDNTFIGTAHVRDARGTVHEIDARPSDLIALALRAACPIYVDAQVLAAAELEIPGRVAAGR